MVLIDTSVWIDFLRRGGDSPLKLWVGRLLKSKNAAYTCPIYFELMSGAKPNELPDLSEALSLAQRFTFLPSYWDDAAILYRELRHKGITVPKPDLYIAVAASRLRMPLFCKDAHLKTLERDAGMELRLYETDEA